MINIWGPDRIESSLNFGLKKIPKREARSEATGVCYVIIRSIPERKSRRFFFIPFHTQVENTDAESVNDLKQGTLCATDENVLLWLD